MASTAWRVFKSVTPILGLCLLLFCIVYVKDSVHPRRDREATFRKNLLKMSSLRDGTTQQVTERSLEEKSTPEQLLVERNEDSTSNETKGDGHHHDPFGTNLIPKHNSDIPFRTSEGLFILLVLLSLCFSCGHVLHKTGFTYLHETGLSILIGVLSGVVIRYSYTPTQLDAMIAFEHDIFFLILLPPIIFESGYNMKRKMFFKNFGSLMGFALAGTIISTMVIAGILMIAEAAGAGMGLTSLDTMIFGSLISATDPVSVLAIFKSMQADQNLFANVFGESVLNDAVAIVLYETCVTFVDTPVTTSTIFAAIGFFFLIFFGSLIIGVIMALVCCTMFKHMAFHHNPMVESAMQVILAYLSYLLADGLGLSGIVAILFCGIAMAQYLIPSLSSEAKDLTTKLWQVWALLTETFVFLYLGLAIFSFGHEYNAAFMFIALFSIYPARAANVFPVSAVVNRTRTVNKIPWNHQIMIWFSGLRGAIAMALSLEVPTDAQAKIFTTTLFIVIVTVFVMGGLTASMLRWLHIDMGPDAGAEGEKEPDILFKKFDYGSWFGRIDKEYMKPWFTRKVGHSDHHHHAPVNTIELSQLEDDSTHKTVELDEDPSEDRQSQDGQLA